MFLTDLLWRGQLNVPYCSALEGAAQCFLMFCSGGGSSVFLTDLLWRGQHSVSYCSALEGAAH